MRTDRTGFVRSKIVDLIRGFTIVLVVIGHYLPPDSPAWWLAVHDLIYLFHMPVFFFVAGYICRLRLHRCYREHLTRKAHRLLVPYIAIAGIYLTGKLIASTLTEMDHPVTLSTVVNVVVDPVHSFAPFLWFLPVLFTVGAVFSLLRRFGKIVATLSLPLAAGLYLLASNYYLSWFLLGTLYFGAGAMLTERLDLDKQFPHHARVLAVGGFALLTVAGLYWTVEHAWSNAFRFLLLSTLGTAATVFACQSLLAGYYRTRDNDGSSHRSLKVDLLAALGRSSMTIYLFHTMFQGVAKTAFPGLPFLMQAAVSVAAGTFLPILFETLVLQRSGILAFVFLGKSWPKRGTAYPDPAGSGRRAQPAPAWRTAIREMRHRRHPGPPLST